MPAQAMYESNIQALKDLGLTGMQGEDLILIPAIIYMNLI